MAPLNFRGRGYSNVSRSAGFIGNRSAGFINNRSAGFISNRSGGFVGNRSTGFQNRLGRGRFQNRLGGGGFQTNQRKRNVTDARQILQRNNIRNRLGGGSNITDLSQKLRSRTANKGRFGVRSGRVEKSFPQNRFQRSNGLQSQSSGALQRTVPNKLRSSDLNKYVKVHRGGITVTSVQRPKRKLAGDELEQMTLEDLPELERVQAPTAMSPALEARLQEFQASQMRQYTDSSTTVLISNLKHTVTEEDIHELFGVVGEMSNAQLLHPGAALVSYLRKEDAVTAVEQYNNVTLDGMAMCCTILALDTQKLRPSITSRLGERTGTPQPPFRSSSYLSPALPSNSSPILGLRNAGRQVQARQPTRTQFTRLPNSTMFTVRLT